MGQKMDPHGLRVGIIKDWNSKWYANSRDFGDYLVEDHKIRVYVKKKLYAAGISKIEIERTAKFVRVNVYTAKPGIVIGKGGNLAESLKAEIEKMINKEVNLNIVEVKNVDLDAQLVAENIAMQCSDDELLLYAFMTEKAILEKNTEISGEEKASRLQVLEKKIEDLANQYEVTEDGKE